MIGLTYNQYEIKDFKDITKLSEKQVDRFLVELKDIIMFQKREMLKQPDPEQIQFGSIIWRDDGRNVIESAPFKSEYNHCRHCGKGEIEWN